MIQTIVFSRDRAAQLDLLLRSLVRLTRIIGQITVLYRYTSNEHRLGYELCKEQHKTVVFEHEHDFQTQTRDLIHYGAHDHLMFLCDDDIVVGLWNIAEMRDPTQILENHRDILCVSLRLGENTTQCYPLRIDQGTPNWERSAYGAKTWLWRNEAGDWNYPGSLDGHIFERNLLRTLLANADYQGPNQLEEELSRGCLNLWREYPLMACYDRSLISGVPINLVNDTHRSNRHGETHQRSTEELNDQYLEGKRLNLGTIRAKDLTAAHNELDLIFT